MSALNQEVNEKNRLVGRCLQGNWTEEKATALLDRSCINKNGHTGILTLDVAAKVHEVTTFNTALNTPKNFGVRQKGRRTELLEKDHIKKISDQIHAELNPEPLTPEWSSVTKTDYRVEGFTSVQLPLTKEHNYITEQAITFWSDNYQKIQGVTAVKTKDSAFRRNATFSTPISEQLDCMDDTMLNLSENGAHSQ